MRRFLAVLVCGVTVAGAATADVVPRFPWQTRNRPRPDPEPKGTAEPAPPPEPTPPRRGLCSWLPIAGLTAAPLSLGYWMARRNRRANP